jgi:hypothetical protein
VRKGAKLLSLLLPNRAKEVTRHLLHDILCCTSRILSSADRYNATLVTVAFPYVNDSKPTVINALSLVTWKSAERPLIYLGAS